MLNRQELNLGKEDIQSVPFEEGAGAGFMLSLEINTRRKNLLSLVVYACVNINFQAEAH